MTFRPVSALRSTRSWCTVSRAQERWLEPGDIISIDVGATYKGWVGDSGLDLPGG